MTQNIKKNNQLINQNKYKPFRNLLNNNKYNKKKKNHKFSKKKILYQ